MDTNSKNQATVPLVELTEVYESCQIMREVASVLQLESMKRRLGRMPTTEELIADWVGLVKAARRQFGKSPRVAQS